jgi:hypothetical protein
MSLADALLSCKCLDQLKPDNQSKCGLQDHLTWLTIQGYVKGEHRACVAKQKSKSNAS